MSTGAQLSIMAIESVVEQGGNLSPVTTLACRITGAQSTLEVRWRHENETFTEANIGKYEVTINPLQPGNLTVLVITDLVYTDSGVYICEAMDSTTTSWVSATVELRLLSECTTHNIQCTHVLLVCLYCYTVQLNVNESSLIVNSNVSTVQLSCDMAGYVPPTSDLQWYRNGSMLQNSSDYIILYRNGNRNALLPSNSRAGPSVVSVLVITDPQVQDTGEYQCVIVSLNISDIVQLTVLAELTTTVTLTPSSPQTTTTTTNSECMRGCTDHDIYCTLSTQVLERPHPQLHYQILSFQ